ncbi:exopolysaccharide biosynthesis protein [Shimia ponticola]|uniref:exopolysaccharide biosynthesis protein n=1 Tax=Shimia ponticola TaxID=2582893 RepID=UPI00164AF949|nr:exopolysaccharide biosynthesis protein [Shimia ponticola]
MSRSISSEHSAPASTPSAPVNDMLDRASGLKDHDTLTFGDVLGEFGRASFLPLLILLGLALASPLSGIPLFSSVAGLSIALIAFQGAAGRSVIWLPKAFLSKGVKGARAASAIKRLRGIATWLDARTARRWHLLTDRISGRVLMGIAGCAGAATPLLELIPFSSSLIGLGTVLIALALLVRDGVVALAGLGAFAAAAVVPFTVATTLAN